MQTNEEIIPRWARCPIKWDYDWFGEHIPLPFLIVLFSYMLICLRKIFRILLKVLRSLWNKTVHFFTLHQFLNLQDHGSSDYR